MLTVLNVISFVPQVRNLFEPAHDKTYNMTCANREDSDQPVYPRSPIRAFADRMYLLQPPGNPERGE